MLEMTDMEEMSYFFRVYVICSDKTISISQKKYARKIVEKLRKKDWRRNSSRNWHKAKPNSQNEMVDPSLSKFWSVTYDI